MSSPLKQNLAQENNRFEDREILSANVEGPEFLIRTGEEDFKIRKISGIEAASFFRPSKVLPDRYEIKELLEGGAKAYLIKNIQTGKIVSLSGKAFNLWNEMDGRTTLRALAAGYFLKYGAFSFDEIHNLVRQLHSNGLIETKVPPLVRVHKVLENSKNPILRFIARIVIIWASIGFDIRDVDVKVDRLHQKIGSILFNKIFIIVLSVIGCLATTIFVRSLISQEYDISSFFDSTWKWVVAYFVIALNIPFHEFGHTLSTKHFGYRVRSFGFGLMHHIYPVFYADVTDIWMAPARQRMVVASAGLFIDWVFGSIAVLFSFLFPSQKYLMYLIAFNSYAIALINLYPFFFLELDGYYILVDFLKLPHLKREAIQLFKGHIQRRMIFPFCYGIISFVSLGLVFWYVVWSFLN